MFRHHAKHLDGQIDPLTGYSVKAYGREIDFEYQTRQHLSSALRLRPGLDPIAEEASIRTMLRVGQAWLWDEPARPEQLDLFA